MDQGSNSKLRPFRDYSEHDVINLFAFGDDAQALNASDVVHAGSVVKVKSPGWTNGQETEFLGDVGADFNNTVSERYGVTAEVEYTDGGGEEASLGITLYDVREYDENGEALKFNPRKQAELQCSLTGQAVPVATRGLFLMATGAWNSPTVVSYNMDVYATGDGKLTTQGEKTVNNVIGRTLGGPDADGSVLCRFDFLQG